MNNPALDFITKNMISLKITYEKAMIGRVRPNSLAERLHTVRAVRHVDRKAAREHLAKPGAARDKGFE